MRIAFITDSIRKDLTGVGVYTRGLINAFIKHRKDIDFYFLDYKKTSFNKNKLLLFDSPVFTLKKSLWINYLALISSKFNFDFIFNFTGIPHLVPFKQKEIFVVHDLHTILHPEFTSKRTLIYNKLLLKKSLDQSYKILVNSDQTKEEIMKLFSIKEDKIFKIYIPLIKKYSKYTNEYNKKKKKLKKTFIVNIGTLDLRKNIINLIKSFEYLKEKRKIPHQLLLIGKDGLGASKIYNYINRSKYKKDILLKGYIQEENKFFYIRAASLCTYLSFYEGLGIPVFEAAYFYKPIICSRNVPIASEIFFKKMFLVDPYNIKDIYNAMSKAINNYPKVWLNSCKKICIDHLKEEYVKKKIEELYCFLNTSI